MRKSVERNPKAVYCNDFKFVMGFLQYSWPKIKTWRANLPSYFISSPSHFYVKISGKTQKVKAIRYMTIHS